MKTIYGKNKKKILPHPPERLQAEKTNRYAYQIQNLTIRKSSSQSIRISFSSTRNTLIAFCTCSSTVRGDMFILSAISL